MGPWSRDPHRHGPRHHRQHHTLLSGITDAVQTKESDTHCLGEAMKAARLPIGIRSSGASLPPMTRVETDPEAPDGRAASPPGQRVGAAVLSPRSQNIQETRAPCGWDHGVAGSMGPAARGGRRGTHWGEGPAACPGAESGEQTSLGPQSGFLIFKRITSI